MADKTVKALQEILSNWFTNEELVNAIKTVESVSEKAWGYIILILTMPELVYIINTAESETVRKQAFEQIGNRNKCDYGLCSIADTEGERYKTARKYTLEKMGKLAYDLKIITASREYPDYSDMDAYLDIVRNCSSASLCERAAKEYLNFEVIREDISSGELINIMEKAPSMKKQVMEVLKNWAFNNNLRDYLKMLNDIIDAIPSFGEVQEEIDKITEILNDD